MAIFILCWFIIQRSRFLHSAGAAVGMTKRGDVFRYYREQFRPFGPERHIGRSLRFRWRIVPFNHTGCIRNVAGGRLPPLRTHRGVVPFNCTGCIRNVPGTAHRPFPTVSLVGGTIHPHRLYSRRGGRQIAAPTGTAVGGTIQPDGVVFGTWRAWVLRKNPPGARGLAYPGGMGQGVRVW